MPTPDFDDVEFDADERDEESRPRRRRAEREPQGDSTGGLIPYKNPSALIAYYCGVFSLFPVLGFFLGLAGLILGIRGLRFAKEHPETKGQVHAWIGIVMGSLCAIAWGTCIGVGIFAALSERR
jgi:hypothetical protein